MGFEMLDAAGHALVVLLDPYRLLMLSCGVVMGLVLGILPGIGGLSGTALLLPFTFAMDPYTHPRGRELGGEHLWTNCSRVVQKPRHILIEQLGEHVDVHEAVNTQPTELSECVGVCLVPE